MVTEFCFPVRRFRRGKKPTENSNETKGIRIMTLEQIYSKNPVYAHRYDTDKLFMLPAGSASFEGTFDEK